MADPHVRAPSCWPELRPSRSPQLEQAKVDAWFAQFDVNHSGVLEREQLSRLLEHLTGTSPDHVTMEFLMQKAIAIDTTGDGKPDTSGISRASAEAVVAKYAHYVEQQEALQSIFKEFDTHHSGRLERDQLRALLLKVSPGKEVADSDVDYVLNMCNDVNAALMYSGLQRIYRKG